MTPEQAEDLRALGRQVSSLLWTRRNEARYRTLFENIDAGFCVCEVKFDGHGRAIDHRVLAANPAFERHTGLSDVVGRWATEAAPGIEQHWHDAYGQVAKTGQPLRFEGEAAPLGRWYDAHLFPASGGHVAMLIADTTGRWQPCTQAKRSHERTSTACNSHWRRAPSSVRGSGTCAPTASPWTTRSPAPSASTPRSVAGFDVVDVAGAAEAVRVLETRPDIRVVFTDIDMPGSLDGMRFAATIRDRWPPIEFIIVSGRREPRPDELPARGVFFAKPYKKEEITAVMRRMTE